MIFHRGVLRFGSFNCAFNCRIGYTQRFEYSHICTHGENADYIVVSRARFQSAVSGLLNDRMECGALVNAHR